MIALGKKLDLGIVAEAVESQPQLTALRDEGCDFGQGNYFTKPMRAAELRSLLTGARETQKNQLLRFPPVS